MKVVFSEPDRTSLGALVGRNLTEAIGHAIANVFGTTTVEFRNGKFEDHNEIIGRAVELIVFLETCQMERQCILEFSREPCAICFQDENGFSIYDVFDQEKLLDHLHGDEIKNVLDGIDSFLSELVGPYSPEVAEYLVGHRFVRSRRQA